jgi:hypothetical protein
MTLTPGQKARILAFKMMLQEHDKSTLETALRNFESDQHPEREIQIFEHIARVYEAELQARPDADSNQRSLLFLALLSCSFTSDKEELLRLNPDLTALPNLESVIDRYHRRS